MNQLNEKKFIDLAPCPECGGEIRVRVHPARGAWAQCSNCEQETHICGMDEIPVYNGIHIRRSTVNKVYKMWNKRVAEMGGSKLAPCPHCIGDTKIEANRVTGAWVVCKACQQDYNVVTVSALEFRKNGTLMPDSIHLVQRKWERIATQIASGTYKEERQEMLLRMMSECLKDRGYFPSDDQLDELFEIYEDCQEWDERGEVMFTGNTYAEIEDFVRHSRHVDEICDKEE